MPKGLIITAAVLLSVAVTVGAVKVQPDARVLGVRGNAESRGPMESHGVLKNFDVLSFLQEGRWNIFGKDKTIPKFGDCAAAEVGAGVEHPLLKAYRKRYKAAFDAGDYIIGITDAKLTRADMTVEYVNENKESILKITGRDREGIKEDFNCRGRVYKPAQMKIELYNVRVEAKEKSTLGLLNDIPIDKIALDTSIVVDITGHYNPTKSKAMGLPFFDVNDYRYNEEKNEVYVCMGDLKPSVDFKSTFLDVVMNLFQGVVKKSIKNMLGTSLKCYVQQQQSAFVGTLVHEATLKHEKISQLLDSCIDPARCGQDILDTIGQLVGLKDNDIRTARRENIRSKPRMNVALVMNGRYGADQAGKAAQGLDTYLAYKTVVEMTIPTSDMMIMLTDAGSRALDLVKQDAKDSPLTESGEPDTANYVHVLMKEWFEDNMIDIGEVQSLLEFAKQSTIDPEARIGIFANGLDVEMDSLDKHTDPRGSMEVGDASVVIKLPAESKFPMKLMLLAQQFQRNDEFIIALCKEKEPLTVGDCVRRGRVANKEHLKISSDTVKTLLGEDGFHLTGEVNAGARGLVVKGPLDERFWIRMVQSRCALDDQICQLSMGLFGAYVVGNESYFRFLTVDKEVNSDRGIVIDKRIVSFNVINEFKGPMNLGKIIGILVNTNDYLKQAAREKRKLKDWTWNYEDQLGLDIDKEQVAKAQKKTKNYWARNYKRTMQGFLDKLPEGPPPLPSSGTSSDSGSEIGSEIDAQRAKKGDEL